MKITLKLCLATLLLSCASIMTWTTVSADEGCPAEECTMRSDYNVWCCARTSTNPCTYGNDTNWCYKVPYAD